MSIEIWLNPACSKCRTAVSELDAAGVEYTVRRYLDEPPTAAELADVVARLGLEPWDIARAKEAKEEGIDLPREPGPARRVAGRARGSPARDPAPDHHRLGRHHRRRPRPREPRTGHRSRVLNGLADPAARAAAVERLGRLYAGRPVIVGPGILAGYTGTVSFLRELGCDVLVLSTEQGAGAIPRIDECVVVDISVPRAESVTEELRALDHLAHHLPDDVVAAVEEFDPDRRALWHASQFVTDDEPILGRRIVNGRPAAFMALEDKLLAEEIWAAAGVPTAPYEIVPVDAEALAAATARLASPMGAVWSGDTRDGFNGGGNYVRWVADEGDASAALEFFRARCDRVRVMPFLDGVPCSIHGMVLPDGTAVFRPVEIAIVRDVPGRRFVYGGLSTHWDPTPADRETMRDAARRVGEHLRSAYGYRGAFGIDGVMTSDGFRPTELNSRGLGRPHHRIGRGPGPVRPGPDPPAARPRHRSDRRRPGVAGDRDGRRARRQADRRGRRGQGRAAA